MKIIPLISQHKGNYSSFVSKLERPYLLVSEKQFEKIQEMLRYGINGKETDFLLMNGRAATIGTTDNGYAIMPLQKKYSTKIIDKFVSYCDENYIDGISILANGPTDKNILKDDIPSIELPSTLREKNKMQAGLIYSQCGNLKKIDVSLISNPDMLPWNNQVDIWEQISYIERNATYLGIDIATMIKNAYEIHGRKLVSRIPNIDNKEHVKPLFELINSFLFFVQDAVIQFLNANSIIEDDKKLENTIDGIRNSVILASVSRDKCWKLAITKNFNTIMIGDVENLSNYMNDIIELKDIATYIGESIKGSSFYRLKGEILDESELEYKGVSRKLFNCFIQYSQTERHLQSGIENRGKQIPSALKNDSEQSIQGSKSVLFKKQ